MTNKQEIVNYYHTCFSIRQTAMTFKISKYLVRKILSELGIKILSIVEARIQKNITKHNDAPYDRTCSTCKIKKDTYKFTLCNTSPSGYTYECKECKAHKDRLKRYNITKEQYGKLLQIQDNVCAICKKKPEIFYVDHCHKINKVRGLLCSPCNFLIGNATNNPQTLRNGANYLENPPGNNI